MILPDLNLLVFAYNVDAPRHGPAKAWWEDVMTAGRPIGLPWAVVVGFVRLVTHPAVLTPPMAPTQALDHVESWLERSHVRLVEPGPRHLAHLRELLDKVGVAGRLTTDAHLAAISVEHQCCLHSNDVDFGRFPGLRWRDPLPDYEART